MLPIVFIAGPSGVGKDYLADCIENSLGFLHIDIDKEGHFRANDLHKQWHKFETELDPRPLAAAIRSKAHSNDCAGVVVTFPSDRFFSRQKIDAARAVGIETVILWSPEQVCKQARLDRDGTLGNYDQKNAKAFKHYPGVEYSDVRVDALSPHGSRHSCEYLVAIIQSRIEEVMKNF